MPKRTLAYPAPSPFKHLVESLGGIQDAATVFQVHSRTIKNWLAQGGPQRGPAKILCEELLRREGIAA